MIVGAGARENEALYREGNFVNKLEEQIKAQLRR